MSEFTDEQINRYSRHIILPEVGGKGQKKLLESKVFLVGAGGTWFSGSSFILQQQVLERLELLTMITLIFQIFSGNITLN
jgi:hypothetical protein